MSFHYFGELLPYCLGEYNAAARNERTVEVPIAQYFIGEHPGVCLEVGNVLDHYEPVTHRIVDKYERAAGVDNIDVFEIEGEFDCIVSISTIEHIGWDTAYPEQRVMGQSEGALDHLHSLLRPGGAMLVTVPFGQNPALDVAILKGLGTTRECSFLRIGNGWLQQDTTWLPYGPGRAHSVWVGEFHA